MQNQYSRTGSSDGAEGHLVSTLGKKTEVGNTSKGEERGDGTYFEWVKRADSAMQSSEIFWAS